MSEVLRLDSPPSPTNQDASGHSPSHASHAPTEAANMRQLVEAISLRDEFGRPLTRYEREKALKVRRDNGALNLKRLSTRHYKIIQFHLKGWSNAAIASHMSITQSRVSLILSDPLAVQIIQQAHSNVRRDITALVGVAVDTVRSTLINPEQSFERKMKAIDRLEKLSDMAGVDTGVKTAEDLVQELLSKGATLNLISAEHVQVNNGSKPGD